MIRNVLLLLVLATPAAAQRTYWHGTIAQLAAGTFPHTHVTVDSAIVDYTKAEADSDYHIRLRDPNDTMPDHFVVAECIPKLPCQHPRVGRLVTVWGIYRRDAEHGWFEIHPVERITVW